MMRVYDASAKRFRELLETTRAVMRVEESASYVHSLAALEKEGEQNVPESDSGEKEDVNQPEQTSPTDASGEEKDSTALDDSAGVTDDGKNGGQNTPERDAGDAKDEIEAKTEGEASAENPAESGSDGEMATLDGDEGCEYEAEDSTCLADA